jgi:hypothetical protein
MASARDVAQCKSAYIAAQDLGFNPQYPQKDSTNDNIGKKC